MTLHLELSAAASLGHFFFLEVFLLSGGKPLVGQIKLQIQAFRYSTSRSSSLRYPRGKGLGFVM